MKKFISLSLVLIMVISLAAIGLAGCSTSTTSGTSGKFAFDTGDPDTLTVIQNFDPQTFQPGVNDEQAGLRIWDQIYEPLFMLTNEGEVTPWLATEYTWETPTRMVVKLRDDVKFSDGNPFTAEDVVFTLTHAKEIALPNPFFNLIDTAEVVDAHTVAFNLKAPQTTMSAILCNGQCGIGSKKAFEDGKGDYLGASAIGTGPYKLVSYTPGDMINLTANENYWREGEPKIKNIDMRVVLSAESRSTEAKSLQNDIVIDCNTRDYPQIDALDGIHVDTQQTAKTVYLFLNSAKAPMDNPKVREAFARAIDVTQTVKLAYGDYGMPATAMVSPNILGRNEDTYKKYYGTGHDVAAAKALLAEAGYSDGLDLEIAVNNTNTQRCDMAEAMQAQVKEAGINLAVNKLEDGPMREYINGGKHQMCIYAFTCITMEGDGFLSQIQPGSSNLAQLGYANQAFFDKYLEGASTTDRAARGKIWEDCLEMLMQDYAMVPLWHTAIGAAVRDNVQGFSWATDYEETFYQYCTK